MPAHNQNTIQNIALLLKLPKWGKEEIEKVFSLLILCATEKAGRKFELDEALQLSTLAVDYEGMHIIKTLIGQNYTTPEAVFEQFARTAAREFIKQVDVLNDYLATAVLIRLHEDYETKVQDDYSVHPDFLLKYIKEEIDWYHVKKLDLGIDQQMETAGLGKYAEILRNHIRDNNISKYRGLIEDKRLVDLLIEKEEAFLIALESSMSQGMSETEAIKHNWSILIQQPSPGT